MAKGKKEKIVEPKQIYQDLLMATGSNEIRAQNKRESDVFVDSDFTYNKAI